MYDDLESVIKNQAGMMALRKRTKKRAGKTERVEYRTRSPRPQRTFNKGLLRTALFNPDVAENL